MYPFTVSSIQRVNYSELQQQLISASNSEIQYDIIALFLMQRIRLAMKLWGCSPKFVLELYGVSHQEYLTFCNYQVVSVVILYWIPILKLHQYRMQGHAEPHF